MDYDFSTLNDKEFEILATDILTVLFEKRFERFKSWKDWGVDWRFFADPGKEIIVQAKHRKDYPEMIRKLRNDEFSKVEKLSPARYIFVTSLPLSRANKIEIFNLFTPWIRSESDIFGREDLNDILAKYPQIEERHFKLWISSTGVLMRLLNSAIIGRSSFELERMKRKARLFAETSSFAIALEILKDKGVLIISWEPGAWKTTIADNLCLRLVWREGYTLVSIEENISEAEALLVPDGRKILFYYDDFLWSNYREAIEGKEDSHIVKFIDRVRSDKTKIFILTSRTNILNNGFFWSHIFSNSTLRKNEFLLEVSKLTDLDKARILYNHLQSSCLPAEFLDKFYENKWYLGIIRHKAFNPRLIEFILSSDHISSRNPEEYWQDVQSLLENPRTIWGDCFTRQNDAFVRGIVLLVVFSWWQIAEAELKLAFGRLKKNDPTLRPSWHAEKSFNSTIQLATRSFLNRESSADGQVRYSLFNPSISDFVFHEYRDDVERLVEIQKALESENCFNRLEQLRLFWIIDSGTLEEVARRLFSESVGGKYDIDFMASVARSLVLCEDKRDEIRGFIMQTVQGVNGWTICLNNIRDFLSLIRLFDEKTADVGFLTKILKRWFLDESELESLGRYLADIEFDECDDSLIDALKDNVENFVYQELDSDKGGVDLDSAIDIEFDQDWFVTTTTVDERQIRASLMSISEGILNRLPIAITTLANIDLDSIVRNIDMEGAIDDYVSLFWYDGSSERDLWNLKSIQDMTMQVEDLFERDL